MEFELAQSEIHAETLRVLQHRFEKEKRYWENLTASKNETIARLEREIQEQTLKTNHLREKIQELQSEQSGIVQQSFSTLELQKRSFNSHNQKLETELEASRKDMLDLKLDLEEERGLKFKLKAEWEEKENKWREEKQRREIEIENIKKDMLSKRETELEDFTKVEETVKKLKRELSDAKTFWEKEKAGLEALLNESNSQIGGARDDLDQTRKKLEAEKEERRLAAMEREKQAAKAEEDRARLTEQVLLRETRIKELERNLDQLSQERREGEEILRTREDQIAADEEAVRRRREEWIDSVRAQAGQELNISEKSVDLLSKLESKLGLRPPSIPYSQAVKFSLPPSIQKDADRTLEDLAEKYPSLRSGVTFLRKREGWILVLSGLLLFALTTMLVLFESQGRKTARAQTLLQKGNDYFTRGDLDKSFKHLELAYSLDSENTIIRNSFVLVLGELAHKEKREGKLDLALKRVETLYQVLPEDPDVVRLHGEILQALGKNSPPAPVPSAPKSTEASETQAEPAPPTPENP